jgi:ABC-type branched-subunit amino acid transport system substrate-binding protein
MLKWKTPLTLVAAMALVAGACGDDDDSTSSETTEQSAATTTEASEDTETTEASEDTDTTEATATTDGADEGSAAPAGDVTTDVGVEGNTIKIGYNAALSGIFASTVAPIQEAQDVYWEVLNENGGIGGYQIEPVTLDNVYEVPPALENYEEFSGDGANAVVMIGRSDGSPHTAAYADALVDDELTAIPLTWYSGWADPDIGENVLEIQTNYCMEAMNGVTYLSEEYGTNLAIISFPGEYGQDGAQGAKKAAEALGLNIVYDGEGAVVPGADQTPVITELVNSGADIVWTSVNPTTLAEIMGGAVAQGFTAHWSGNAPSWGTNLLGTDLANVFDQYWTYSAYTELWNTGESPGMQELVAAMREKRPNAPLGVADYYVLGWINGLIVTQILEAAIANGDLTRAGVTAAAKEVTVDLQGLAPNQTWAGEPNDYVVRESYLYRPDSTLYNASGTVSDEDGVTGYHLIKGPYVSPTAEAYDFQEACFAG